MNLRPLASLLNPWKNRAREFYKPIKTRKTVTCPSGFSFCPNRPNKSYSALKAKTSKPNSDFRNSKWHKRKKSLISKKCSWMSKQWRTWKTWSRPSPQRRRLGTFQCGVRGILQRTWTTLSRPSVLNPRRRLGTFQCAVRGILLAKKAKRCHGK